jgi:hypothetical protein
VQLAARIAVSNLHKNTMKSFSETYVFLFFHIGGNFDDPQSCHVAFWMQCEGHVYTCQREVWADVSADR